MKKFAWFPLLLSVVLLASCTSCSSVRGFPPTSGILNFDKVNDHLYRGAQPNQIGLQALREVYKVNVIINFRDKGDVWLAEKDVATQLGIVYIWLPLNGASSPDPITVEKAMHAYQNAVAQGQRLFWHCQHGCDRTGTLTACVRIRFEGWSNQAALAEAKIYGISPLEFGMRHFIKTFK